MLTPPALSILSAVPFEIYRGSPELFAIPRYSEAGPDVGKKYVKLCDVTDGTIEMHVYQPSESAGVGPHPVYINYHGTFAPSAITPLSFTSAIDRNVVCVVQVVDLLEVQQEWMSHGLGCW